MATWLKLVSVGLLDWGRCMGSFGRMGSVALLDWGRCAGSCGKSLWPLREEVCVDCFVELQAINEEVSWRRIVLRVLWTARASSLRDVCVLQECILRELCVRTVFSADALWSRHYLRWIATTPSGSDLSQFTFFGNGEAGNIDTRTDIIDLILDFVI